MRTIKVISKDKDGAELRREKKGHYSRCDGKKDSEEINEAIDYATKNRTWFIPEKIWERIFK